MKTFAKIAGIIVAAGYSSRMGNFKPLLPLGGKTALETAVESLRQGGVADIWVVTGHRSEELQPVLAKAKVKSAPNPDYADGMFSSVAAGLKALTSRQNERQNERQDERQDERQNQIEAFFLLPGDTPLIRKSSLRALLKEQRRTGAAVIQPVFNSQPGHPPLIGKKCFAEILTKNAPDGLRGILAKFAADTCQVEVPDEGILLDMDTPLDYGELTKFYAGRNLPTYLECASLLAKYQPNPAVFRHCRAVAALGGKLAGLLNEFGLSLDTDLIIAASLVHDVAKGRKNHAQKGGRLLACWGFSAVSKIVSSHMDIEFKDGQPIDEAAIVFLADKLIQGDRLVTIAERFSRPLQKFAFDAKITAAVLRRFKTAETIQNQIISLTGITRFNESVLQGGAADGTYLFE